MSTDVLNVDRFLEQFPVSSSSSTLPTVAQGGNVNMYKYAIAIGAVLIAVWISISNMKPKQSRAKIVYDVVPRSDTDNDPSATTLKFHSTYIDDRCKTGQNNDCFMSLFLVDFLYHHIVEEREKGLSTPDIIGNLSSQFNHFKSFTGDTVFILREGQSDSKQEHQKADDGIEDISTATTAQDKDDVTLGGGDTIEERIKNMWVVFDVDPMYINKKVDEAKYRSHHIQTKYSMTSLVKRILQQQQYMENGVFIETDLRESQKDNDFEVVRTYVRKLDSYYICSSEKIKTVLEDEADYSNLLLQIGGFVFWVVLWYFIVESMAFKNNVLTTSVFALITFLFMYDIVTLTNTVGQVQLESGRYNQSQNIVIGLGGFASISLALFAKEALAKVANSVDATKMSTRMLSLTFIICLIAILNVRTPISAENYKRRTSLNSIFLKIAIAGTILVVINVIVQHAK